MHGNAILLCPRGFLPRLVPEHHTEVLEREGAV
jgi:hypothetical protein